MTTKTISILDEVYRLLLERKRNSESFSDVIRRELSGKRDIMALAGAWKHIPNNKIEKMKKSIYSLRQRSTKELFAQA